MARKCFTNAINTGLSKQGLKHTTKDVPVFIALREGLDLNYCFIEHESDEVLTVAETTKNGTEEIRTIRKDMIIYIGVIYQNLELDKEDDGSVHEQIMYN